MEEIAAAAIYYVRPHFTCTESVADGGREGLRKILMYSKGGDDTICEEGEKRCTPRQWEDVDERTVCGVRDRNGAWWEVIRKARRE